MKNDTRRKARPPPHIIRRSTKYASQPKDGADIVVLPDLNEHDRDWRAGQKVAADIFAAAQLAGH